MRLCFIEENSLFSQTFYEGFLILPLLFLLCYSRTSIFMDNSLGLRRRTQTVSGDPNLYDRHETHSPRSPNYLQINGNRGDLSPRKKHLR